MREDIDQREDTSGSPSALKTAWVTRSGSSMGASAAMHAPSLKLRAISAAARIARRVLPAPPLPVRVKRRVEARCVLTSASSRRRPTNEVSSAGRLPCFDLVVRAPIWSADYTAATKPILAVATMLQPDGLLASSASGGR